MASDKKSVFVISSEAGYTIRVFFFRLNRATTNNPPTPFGLRRDKQGE
jgi:hypothetical protein